jgi:hypothetical protein
MTPTSGRTAAGAGSPPRTSAFAGRRWALGALVAVALLGGASPLAGQADRWEGRVVVADSGTPVPGVTVLLVDAAGRQRGGGFTDADGVFRLSAVPRAGDQLRIERLGFESHDHLFEVAPEEGAPRFEVGIRMRPLSLVGLTVETEARCAVDADRAGRTHELWEAARTSLRAARLSEDEGLVLFRVRSWTRVVTGEDREVELRSERVETTTGSTFVTLPPEDLAARGFVRRTDDAQETHGPDARFLLSDVFTEVYCFRVTDVPGTDEDRVGLGFHPQERPGPEVRIAGTLWLHADTGELDEVEFSYMNWSANVGEWRPLPGDSGGFIRYRVLPDGRWVVDSWRIRMLTGIGRGGLVYDEAGGKLEEILASRP